jgi:hypothetical protein
MAAADEGPLALDLIAASLRADRSDLGAYVEGLAAKLEEAVPGLVRIERTRQGLFGPKLVRRIALDAGGERLELRRGDRDQLECTRGRMSGGIVLKTEPLGSDEWTQALTRLLSLEAGRSEQTRRALERLLLG